MKNKILIGVIIVLALILGVVINKNHSFFSKEPTIKVKTPEEKIEELNLEEYLVGVLASEMPASFETEALKAQAVASRTYALYKIEHNTTNNYDILTDVTNQTYITKEQMQEKWLDKYDYYLSKITNAIKETEKEVMFYNNEVIEAFYFAMSNGYTEDAQTVFGSSLPYIKTTSSTWDNDTLNKFQVTTQFTQEEFCNLLELTDCKTLTIKDVIYTDSNRINSLVINNKKFLGTELRRLLNLRSTDISFSIENNKVNITTKGYGHGVGMSQYGANGMAKEGYKYQDILNHYYKDIIIKKVV